MAPSLRKKNIIGDSSANEDVEGNIGEIVSLKPKTKLRAMGFSKLCEIDPLILNAGSTSIFKEPHPGNVRKCHGAQYFDQFKESVEGTRAKWKSHQLLVFIRIKSGEKDATSVFNFERFREAFEAFYLNLSVMLLDESLLLVKTAKEGEFALINEKLQVYQRVRSFKNAEGERVNLSSSDIITAQKALMSKFLSNNDGKGKRAITNKEVFSTISFVDEPIIIECNPDDIITGRARGYDGAVISMKGCGEREVITTALHESMHVFSIDHCVWWDCIMNFSYEYSNDFSIGGPIHVCPSCLAKLRYQLDFDVIHRYTRMAEFCEKVGYKKDAKFAENVVLSFKKA